MEFAAGTRKGGAAWWTSTCIQVVLALSSAQVQLPPPDTMSYLCSHQSLGFERPQFYSQEKKSYKMLQAFENFFPIKSYRIVFLIGLFPWAHLPTGLYKLNPKI